MKGGKMNVLITGAAGYIGSMLLDAFGQLASVTAVIGVDLKPLPERHAAHPKLQWIQACVAEDTWIEAIRGEPIDVVVHGAYQVRQLYGAAGSALQQRWNLDGARRVFGFALGTPSVRRLIQLSTISAYGAKPTNVLEAPFTEAAPLAEDSYRYGAQKAEIEALLRRLYAASDGATHAVVLRLASVSGPYGRFGLNRYGLVSTLAGRFPVVPCGRGDWCRQYLHEDDLVDIITVIATAPPKAELEVLNAAPADYLTGADLARSLGKHAFTVPPPLLRALFALLWHGTRGIVATPAGAWRFLSYPIRADGTRLTRTYGHVYRYSSAAALLAQQGRYAARPKTAATCVSNK
jgi:nucleoside-diphosphate-sugar epimerase